MEKHKLISEAKDKLRLVEEAKKTEQELETELRKLFSDWLSDFDDIPADEKRLLVEMVKQQFISDETPVMQRFVQDGPLVEQPREKNTISLAVTKKSFMYDRPLRECVGYQPMNGPQGMAIHLRYEQRPATEEEIKADLSIKNTPPGCPEIQPTIVSVRFQSNPIVAEAYMLDKTLRAEDPDCVNKIATEIAKGHLKYTTEAILYKAATRSTGDFSIARLRDISNEIYMKVLRGPGNFVWYSPDLEDIVVQATNSNSPHKKPSGLSYLCEFRHLKFYENISLPEKTIIVGYKGKDERDCGCAICPYVTLIPTPKVTTPEGDSRPLFITRFGRDLDTEGGKAYAVLQLT